MCLPSDGDATFSKTFELTDVDRQMQVTPPPSPNPSVCSSASSTASSTSSNLQHRRRVHPTNSNAGSGSRRIKRRQTTSNTVSLQDEVDQLMDHSIEIDSNKKIRNEHVNPWTLQFLQEELEFKVSSLTHFFDDGDISVFHLFTISFSMRRCPSTFHSFPICGKTCLNPTSCALSSSGY